MGILWLVAAGLLVAAATAAVAWPRGWWMLGALALLASQGAIISAWHDARFGTIANLVLLLGVAYAFASRGPSSLGATYERHVRAIPPAAPSPALTEADLAPLPAPVQRYVRGAGALGRPRPNSFRAAWTGHIRGGATEPWMAFTAEQVSTLEPPRRFFKMDAVLKGLPVDVLHVYDDAGATMRVKVLSVYPMADARGPELTRAETVTVLNDLCVLAPATLTSPRIRWQPVDASTARAWFTAGGNTISAELRFDAAGELVDFVSDDRRASSADGRSFTPMRWSTPLRDYTARGPARVATHGDAVWSPAAGPAYVYGEFDLTALSYDPRP